MADNNCLLYLRVIRGGIINHRHAERSGANSLVIINEIVIHLV